MTYDDFCVLETEAWDAFIAVFEKKGINGDDLISALDSKDCYNDVTDAVLSVVVLECEDE